MKNKKRVWLILTAVWMAVIFSFSAKPADESSKESLFVGKVVGRIFVDGFEDMSKEEQEAFAEKINYPVRKTAHASEYAVLGFLLFQTAAAWKWFGERKDGAGLKRTGGAWLIGTGYAVSDELHQLFVPGRACMATDVMIDSGGVLAGIAAGALALLLLESRKEK